MKPAAAVRRHRRYPTSNFGGAWRYVFTVSVQDVDLRKNEHSFGRGGRKLKLIAPRACACAPCWGWGVDTQSRGASFFRILS